MPLNSPTLDGAASYYRERGSSNGILSLLGAWVQRKSDAVGVGQLLRLASPLAPGSKRVTAAV